MFKVKEIQRYIELANKKLDKIGNRDGSTIWKVIGTYKTLSTKSYFIQYYVYDMLTKNNRVFMDKLYSADWEGEDFVISPTDILADVLGATTMEEFNAMTNDEMNIECLKSEEAADIEIVEIYTIDNIDDVKKGDIVSIKEIRDTKLNESSLVVDLVDDTIKSIKFDRRIDSDALIAVNVTYHRIMTNTGDNVLKTFYGRTISNKYHNMYKQLLRGAKRFK